MFHSGSLRRAQWGQPGSQSHGRSPSHSPVFLFYLSAVRLIVLRTPFNPLVPLERAECGLKPYVYEELFKKYLRKSDFPDY